MRDLDFNNDDRARYQALSEKAREASLSSDEARELDAYPKVDSLLAILRLKAERSLRH